jgi:phage-related holin
MNIYSKSLLGINITPKLLNTLFTLLANNVSTTQKKIFFYILLNALISDFLKNNSRIIFLVPKAVSGLHYIVNKK